MQNQDYVVRRTLPLKRPFRPMARAMESSTIASMRAQPAAKHSTSVE